MTIRRVIVWTGAAAAAAALTLGVATLLAIGPLPDALPPVSGDTVRAQLLDRHGQALMRTWENEWNLHDQVSLHEIPALLRAAFIEAEDRRFFEHGGVDWRARLAALTQNLRAGRAVRGASTITEQVVRMLHPRKRTVWSRWVEGFEATRLEREFSKGEIFEFYLNQVPYARQRRGVVQAARDAFDRDLETLNTHEVLALAVLVRSPSRLDLRRSPKGLAVRVEHLAERLTADGVLGKEEVAAIRSAELELSEPQLPVEAPHFVRTVRERVGGDENRNRVTTHLDGTLQKVAESVLFHRLELLAERGAGDGAVLVVDHRSDEVLAWVNAGGFDPSADASQIDAILTPRQPGSTLKPFLYAAALEQGWTAATVLDDAPLARPVAAGMHEFRNYSRTFYGPVRLREALGNSLNIPAVRAARRVTPAGFYQQLRDLGFDSLDQHPDVYGEGLALGNGEVTLFELVDAFATLARGGVRRPLRFAVDEVPEVTPRRILDEEVSSILADILSDPQARRLEFGSGGVLEMPVQTAVKTGTSNDYRDAWAIGFSDRHTVGVWMGNLDRREMEGVSGAIGPGIVLRSVFAELRRRGDEQPLSLSPKLRRRTICRETGLLPQPTCPTVEEWFRDVYLPTVECPIHGGGAGETEAASGLLTAELDQTGDPSSVSGSRVLVTESHPRLLRPTPGLHLALDPRIPDDLESFPFEVEEHRPITRIEWIVDDAVVAVTGSEERSYLWPLIQGEHLASARIWSDPTATPRETPPVVFLVK